MKHTFNVGGLFIAAVAIGAGVEIGRVLTVTGFRLLTKSAMEDVKTEYRRKVKQYERKGVHLVMTDDGPEVVRNNEAPTGATP